MFFYRVFEKCHKLSSPDPFYTACKYDVCRMGNSSGCYSLEAYASTCADVSVCVDWRNSTNGLCGEEQKTKLSLKAGLENVDDHFH